LGVPAGEPTVPNLKDKDMCEAPVGVVKGNK